MCVLMHWYTMYIYIQSFLAIEMKIFIEKKAEKGLSEEQLNIKLEGVMIVFRNSLGQIEDLDREIEQIALSVVPEDWSPAHDKLLEERSKTIIIMLLPKLVSSITYCRKEV